MHPVYRVLSAVFAVLTIICAGIVLAVTYGWVVPQAYLQSFLAISENRLIVSMICALVIILAVLLIVATGRGVQRHRELMIRDTGYGRVDITSPALEDLIRRAARQVRGIREIRPVLRYENEGIAVNLNLNVSPDASLPDLAREVQETVQCYLEEKAGINVQQVKVLIEGVSFESHARVE